MQDDTTIEIPLGRSDIAALIDVDDFDRVNQHRWRLNPSSGYVQMSRHHSKTVHLHRFILNAPPDKQVDHVNQNPLDCRRENLRLATHSENQRNRPKLRNNTSGYKGVFSAPSSSWQARIKANGLNYYLGSFRTKEEAARAYDKAAKKLHGEFACLNFPD